MRSVSRVALPAALAILFAGAFFTPQLASHEDVAPPAIAAVPAPMQPTVSQARDDVGSTDASEGFTDLYGNEINDAIATYTFDQAGSLYELHSPQTEIPRLGSPKS